MAFLNWAMVNSWCFHLMKRNDILLVSCTLDCGLNLLKLYARILLHTNSVCSQAKMSKMFIFLFAKNRCHIALSTPKLPISCSFFSCSRWVKHLPKRKQSNQWHYMSHVNPFSLSCALKCSVVHCWIYVWSCIYIHEYIHMYAYVCMQLQHAIKGMFAIVCVCVPFRYSTLL